MFHWFREEVWPINHEILETMKMAESSNFYIVDNLNIDGISWYVLLSLAKYRSIKYFAVPSTDGIPRVWVRGWLPAAPCPLLPKPAGHSHFGRVHFILQTFPVIPTVTRLGNIREYRILLNRQHRIWIRLHRWAWRQNDVKLQVTHE